MNKYLVHELTMVFFNDEGIYTPSRLKQPYRLTAGQLRHFVIQDMLVSLAPDGYSDARLVPVICGPITGLPRLLVYRQKQLIDPRQDLLQ